MDSIKDKILKFNINYSNGSSLYYEAIKLSAKYLEEAIKNNLKGEVFINFYHFLCDVFAYRENIGIKDGTSKIRPDSIYSALKNFYERIKHNTKQNKIITNMINLSSFDLLFNTSYNYKFIKIDPENKPEEITDHQLDLYKKYLEDKSLQLIVYETIKNININYEN